MSMLKYNKIWKEKKMKSKLLFLVLLICLTLAFCISASAMTGSGTANDPYIVETSQNFVEINNSHPHDLYNYTNKTNRLTCRAQVRRSFIFTFQSYSYCNISRIVFLTFNLLFYYINVLTV